MALSCSEPVQPQQSLISQNLPPSGEYCVAVLYWENGHSEIVQIGGQDTLKFYFECGDEPDHYWIEGECFSVIQIVCYPGP